MKGLFEDVVEEIHSRAGYPYWVIEACLKLNDCNYFNAIRELETVYGVYNKEREEMIKKYEEYLKERLNNTEQFFIYDEQKAF